MLLAQKGISVNQTNSQGQSALGLALELGQMDAADALFKAGANIENAQQGGCSLLHEAIMRGDTGAARFLIDRKADVNAMTEDDRSVLRLAITHAADEIVEAVCKAGASVNVKVPHLCSV